MGRLQDLAAINNASVAKGLGLDRSAAEVLCAWVPLVLGALAVVLAAWWAFWSWLEAVG